jgi:hypothetical protein
VLPTCESCGICQPTQNVVETHDGKKPSRHADSRLRPAAPRKRSHPTGRDIGIDALDRELTGSVQQVAAA